jgi:hypothetical protein
MKSLLILLSSLTLTALTWKEFKTYEGKFRVLTPTGEMTEKVKNIKTGLGEVAYHTFMNRPEEKNPDCVFYVVNYCDYPKGTFPADSTDLINEFLDETVNESVKAVGGTLTYQSDIQILMNKGKVWRVQYNGDRALIKSKCFLVGDRFYLVQTMMKKEKSMNPSADKFLDSFQPF